MTNTNQSNAASIQFSLLIKNMLRGAFPALLLISLFLLLAGEGDPAWGEYWMVRPLLVVTLAGAAGGAFYSVMDQLGSQLGWNRTLILILSFVVYIIGLWLGSVLGLVGTMWH